jgi:hypothetical protein
MNPERTTIQPAIELHIEELVLHGFAPCDRYRIGDAVEIELARLIAEHGLPGPSRGSASIDQLDAGSFPVSAGASAQSLGSHVAQKAYRHISLASRMPPSVG